MTIIIAHIIVLTIAMLLGEYLDDRMNGNAR
jgi:hypothetical protein